jgi:acyl carrier protein
VAGGGSVEAEGRVEAEGGGERLVAYVVGGEGERLPDAGGWREYLRERLPAYMIPAAYVELEELPLTANGKVDRGKLPAAGAVRGGEAGEYVEARTAVERVVAEVWRGVLGVERVGVHDNFFDLGGHSLLATQVVSRVRDTFEVELPLRRLFEEPTVARLVEVILEEPVQRARVEKTAELLLMLEELSDDEAGQMLDERDVPASGGGTE